MTDRNKIILQKIDDFREAHTEIPWKELRGLRNIYAHNYQGVDYELAWEALVSDLPQIK